MPSEPSRVAFAIFLANGEVALIGTRKSPGSHRFNKNSYDGLKTFDTFGLAVSV